MKNYAVFQTRKYDFSQKVLLYFLLLGSGMIMFFPILWTNYKIKLGLGIYISQMALTYQVVFLLVFVAIGFFLAFIVELSIRDRKAIFSSPQVGSWPVRIAYWWGYELLTEGEPTQSAAQVDLASEANNINDWLKRPRRRGRKPAFPLERWLPIAIKWESRDSMRDAFTLEELIAEHLGTNADGSPVVTVQAYYNTWRDLAIEELQKMEKEKKKKT
jgi:hypothetical protein